MTATVTGPAVGRRARTVTATRPYPWPFDGDLTVQGTVLLVVTAAGTTRDATVTARIDALATALHARGGTVVGVTTCLDGVGPVRARRRPAGGGQPGEGATGRGQPAGAGPVSSGLVDHVRTARRVDAFYATDLDLLLSTLGTRRLLLAGAPLETSVHSTLRTANDRGLECLLLEDAVIAHDAGLHAAALSTIEMSGGIFGAVGRSTNVITALTDAAGPTHAEKGSP